MDFLLENMNEKKIWIVIDTEDSFVSTLEIIVSTVYKCTQTEVHSAEIQATDKIFIFCHLLLIAIWLHLSRGTGQQVLSLDIVVFTWDGTFHLVLSHFQDEVETKKQKTDK